MDILEYRLYSDSERQCLNQALDALCRPWLTAWCHSPAVAASVHCEVSGTDVPDSAGAWRAAGSDYPAVLETDRTRDALAALCFGREAAGAMIRSRLADGVLERAFAALLEVFGGRAGETGMRWSASTLPAVYRRVGALAAVMPLGDSDIRLRLPAAWVRQHLLVEPPREPLPAIRLATLGLNASVTLRATVPGATLTVQELTSLRPGDVVRLDHPAEGAVELRLKDGTTLACGIYGTFRDQSAVRLVES
ncbi:FliM/FliN family flagellar motor switch protein [Paludibacterium paludis]|uniref:Flagellar motor switch protein FliN-like C-terminal domain-containing protein n=1 Tax=Paludibacterium paludis TaxID=1225769 RepID=A0A918UC83_9NEIS|nr:FliM/FliN family flagellar motor C-terminal domain-containing protein [Paludibacterium paludis]GGY28898.1 hypothetical protein GCM10011289_35090 [Paludibacterium paludis]